MLLPTKQMTPVLKWAGGKSQLLPAIKALLPASYADYYEPFVGAGALFLAIAPTKAHINDINRELINLYEKLKESPDQVIKYVHDFDAITCDKDYYLALRQKYNQKISAKILDAECAALMIWLNKHCFNGLYRVNSRGLFNVPYNNKTNGSSIDEENVKNIANYLQKAAVEITCTDFAGASQSVKENDFVYFDSPYVPESATADFTAYAKNGFKTGDHERLATLFKELDQKGAKLMLSNNDVEMVRDLYSGYKFSHLSVKRLINREAAKRQGKEVIITNY